MPKEHPEWFDPNEREEDGRWKKGVSGNPKGRGHSRGKATMAVEAMLGDELDRLTRKAVELALGGDTTALKICLDRIAPIRKALRSISPCRRWKRLPICRLQWRLCLRP
jgi:hypothetical protein